MVSNTLFTSGAIREGESDRNGKLIAFYDFDSKTLTVNGKGDYHNIEEDQVHDVVRFVRGC